MWIDQVLENIGAPHVFVHLEHLRFKLLFVRGVFQDSVIALLELDYGVLGVDVDRRVLR